jgi:hypothetical protein
VSSRARLITLAHEQGVRVAETEVVSTFDELVAWCGRYGLPAVLKTDGSYGGRGARVVHTEAEANRALQSLHCPPSVARAIKRAIVNRDTNYILPCVLRKRSVVNAQRYIRGRDANTSVVCWSGEILAEISVDVLQKLEWNGPASVVRVTDNPEMRQAVEKIVRRLRLSGLFGFDFIIEEQTGYSYLIEMNPRATQIGHLSLGAGHDLPASLRSVLSREVVAERPRETDKELIAFFPQEWLRDPRSEFLKTAYHDVPWDEPDLIRVCLRESFAYRVWSAMSSRMRLTRGQRLEESALTIGGLE